MLLHNQHAKHNPRYLGDVDSHRQETDMTRTEQVADSAEISIRAIGEGEQPTLGLFASQIA